MFIVITALRIKLWEEMTKAESWFSSIRELDTKDLTSMKLSGKWYGSIPLNIVVKAEAQMCEIGFNSIYVKLESSYNTFLCYVKVYHHFDWT